MITAPAVLGKGSFLYYNKLIMVKDFYKLIWDKMIEWQYISTVVIFTIT